MMEFERKLQVNLEKRQAVLYIPLIIVKTLGLRQGDKAKIFWDGFKRKITVIFE